MDWWDLVSKRTCTAEEAISRIPKGKHVFIASGASEPVALVEALVASADRFADNTLVHLLTLGPAPYVNERYKNNFRHNAFFIGANVREAVHKGFADYTPVFLSQIPQLIRSERMPVDVALIHVSPPDDFGFVNLGVSVDVALAAIETADLVIAQMNPQMPVVHGAGFLPADRIDCFVKVDAPLLEQPPDDLDEIALEIGRYVASLVEDGATLQLGIGQIPDATLKALTDKKDLGIWTEMFSDGVLDLYESGNITGHHKTIHPEKITSSFTFGSKRLYDFLDRNPVFTFHPSDYVNDPIRIARQHKMVAINSALQIDLTGQVCADSIGTKFYSGIGGQVDFIRGASMCPEGKPIIAIRSTARKNTLSRIVPTLDAGAGVVTTRGDVKYVVTEYGIADLQGKSVRERALSLISVAHPDFRGELLAAAKERHYVFLDQVPPRSVYPRKYERTAVTSEGREVLLRPIRVTDEPKLRDLFYSLSDSTIYKRFLTVIRTMPHKELQYYLDVDYKKNMALVVEASRKGTESEIVGVAQYFQNPATLYADIAFVVRDEWQGQGLGSLLLQELINVAQDSGVEGFTADVLGTNTAMMHVFHKCGLSLESALSEGVYRIRMPLREKATQRRPEKPPRRTRRTPGLRR